MIFFRILWGIDALVSLVLLCSFFVGLSDHSFSADNICLWLVVLVVVAAILLGSLWFRSHGEPGLGIFVLLVLAVPALLYGALLALLWGSPPI